MENNFQKTIFNSNPKFLFENLSTFSRIIKVCDCYPFIKNNTKYTEVSYYDFEILNYDNEIQVFNDSYLKWQKESLSMIKRNMIRFINPNNISMNLNHLKIENDLFSHSNSCCNGNTITLGIKSMINNCKKFNLSFETVYKQTLIHEIGHTFVPKPGLTIQQLEKRFPPYRAQSTIDIFVQYLNDIYLSEINANLFLINTFTAYDTNLLISNLNSYTIKLTNMYNSYINKYNNKTLYRKKANLIEKYLKWNSSNI